jgi:hypothetical protein
MVTYGKTVPKNAITAASSIKDQFNLSSVWVYLANAEIKKSGYLKALTQPQPNTPAVNKWPKANKPAQT